MKVLLTCPPMIGLFEEFRPRCRARGWEVEVPPLVQALDEDELSRRLPACDGWIIGDDPATRRVLAAGRGGRLRAAVKWGIGVDNVDIEAARELGIGFTNTPQMFGDEVADYAMAYVTGLARDLFAVERGVRAGGWPKPAGISLAGRRAGLGGYGDIGRRTARRLRAAGLDVLAYDPARATDATADGVPFARWPQGVETCDFLVFTCALTRENRHMLDRDVLARCRHGVRVVNVARGPLIDTLALVEGLRSGRVAGAALDVFEDEPLPAGHALRAFEQVVFGAHNASNTVDAVRRASLRALDELARLLEAGDG